MTVVAALPAAASHITTHSVDSACSGAPEDGFTDTGAQGSAQETAIDCIAWYGVTGGTSASTYSPTATIKRMQMATMVAEVMRRSATDFTEPAASDDFFVDDDGSTHENNIDLVAKHGVVKGLSSRLYGPTQPVTRGQMATFLVNLLRVVDAAVPAPSQDYFDDDEGSVHEININALAELGIATGRSDRGYEPTGLVTRGQMALFIARTLAELVDQGLLQRPAPPPPPPGDATLTLTTTEVQGGELAGIVSGEGVTGVTLTGCGLTDEAVEDTDTAEDGIQFIETIPASAPTGSCPLTCTVTFDDGRNQSINRTIEVVGTPTVLDGPELVGVEFVSTQGSTTTLRYTFDDGIVETVNRSNFRIYTYDARQVRAMSAGRSGARTVLATFSTSSYQDATVATVAFDAVQDAQGNDNPEGSAPLQDVDITSARTDGPDLVDINDIDESSVDVEVEFEFDEDVDTATADSYHVVLDDGDVHNGEEIVDIDNDIVTVVFDSIDEDDVDDEPIRRVYVAPGGAEDDDGDENPYQSVPVSGDGLTDTPDLVSVEALVDEDRVVYTFDVEVDLISSTVYTKFELYDEDGDRDSADSVTEGPGEFSVTAQFDSGEVSGAVGAFVEASAVRDDDRISNEFDERGVEGAAIAGATVAPDLVAVTRTDTNDEVEITYDFDEEVESETDYEGFIVYTESGTRLQLDGTDCDRVTGDRSKVRCSVEASTRLSTARDAVLGAVEYGVVTDTSNDENQNPEGSFPIEDV